LVEPQTGQTQSSGKSSNAVPAGTPEDTTVVYLVTRGRGLPQSLLPAIAPVDASLNLPAPAAPSDRDGGRDEE